MTLRLFLLLFKKSASAAFVSLLALTVCGISIGCQTTLPLRQEILPTPSQQESTRRITPATAANPEPLRSVVPVVKANANLPPAQTQSGVTQSFSDESTSIKPSTNHRTAPNGMNRSDPIPQRMTPNEQFQLKQSAQRLPNSRLQNANFRTRNIRQATFQELIPPSPVGPDTQGNQVDSNRVDPATENPLPFPWSDSNPEQGAESQQFEVHPTTRAMANNVNITDQNGLVSIVAQDASLSDILAVLGERFKLNFVYAGIDQKINVAVRNVPINDALTSLLSVAGYSWTQHRDIIHVTPLNSANNQNLSPEMSGLQVRVFTLDYLSANDVNQAIVGMLSPSGSSSVIESDPSDNRKTNETIVVEDFPGSIARIERYIAEIDIPPRQVIIEAKVLEVRLRDGEKHGVNFEHIGDIAGRRIRLGTLGVDPSGTSTFFAEIQSDELNGVLDALQTTVDTKTLASPRILALNGQQAKLQVGQQLGFRVITTTQTSTLEDVRFLDVGVVLTITPRISRDGRIMLKVKPEVSSGQINPDTGLPEEETSEVETNVMLSHGRGMIIGGLIQEQDSKVRNQVPRLGEIPLLGHVFRRKEVEKQRSEIIFILMPRIVSNYGSDAQAVEFDSGTLDYRDRIDVRRGNHLMDRCLNDYHRPDDRERHNLEHRFTNERTLMMPEYDQYQPAAPETILTPSEGYSIPHSPTSRATSPLHFGNQRTNQHSGQQPVPLTARNRPYYQGYPAGHYRSQQIQSPQYPPPQMGSGGGKAAGHRGIHYPQRYR